VTIFLVNYFRKYLDYDFTANLEDQLDDVSAGARDYKEVLSRFWADFSAAVAETSELRITEVLEKIDEVLAPQLYPPREDGSDPKSCPTCGAGRLNLKTARSGGAFIGCSNYPECRYTRPLSVGDGSDAELSGDGKLLGHDAGDPITLRAGRFGPYVQRGEATTEQPKPPRASLPKGWAPDSVDLERAVALLALPRPVGPHPEDGVLIEAGIGRFGPYVKHGSTYANLREADEVFTIGMNRAVEVLAQKAARGPGRTAAAPLRELGEHPDGGPIAVMAGRYGPYVKWSKVNATLPKGLEPEAISLEQALELIAAKAGSGKKPAARKAGASAAKPAKAKAKPKAATAKPKAKTAKPKAASGGKSAKG
jgi:DNA topoisomerase-1